MFKNLESESRLKSDKVKAKDTLNIYIISHGTRILSLATRLSFYGPLCFPIFYKHKLFYSIWYKILWYASNDIIWKILPNAGREKETFIGVIWDFSLVGMFNVSYVIWWNTENPSQHLNPTQSRVNHLRKFSNKDLCFAGFTKIQHEDQRTQSPKLSQYHVHQFRHKTQKLKRFIRLKIED